MLTDYEFPPIPDRRFDWAAWVDGREEGPVGRGATESAAIQDLLRDLDADEDSGEPRPIK